MHYVLQLLALTVSASATLVAGQNTQCTFSMVAASSSNPLIISDSIGENRIGGDQRGVYTIAPPFLVDSHGHNCIVDPSSAQFYCSQGTPGNSQFSITADGNLLHNGNSKWLACPVTKPGTDGSFAIFTDTKFDTTGCEYITIKTGEASCQALTCPGGPLMPVVSNVKTSITLTSTSIPTFLSIPPTAATSSVVSAASSIPLLSPDAPSSTASQASCPTDLSSEIFRFPLLIIPTSSQAPNHTFGNSYVAYISAENTTVFNFDVPTTDPYTGTCALLFLFPSASSLSLPDSTYYFSGMEGEEAEQGGLNFALLESVAGPLTAYDTTPQVQTDYGKTEIVPGSNYTIATFPCQSGMTSYSVSSVGNVELDYFQNSAPSPIGLYIVPCSS